MTFRLVRRDEVAPSASPYRVVDETGAEVEWVNRFLDTQRVRGLQTLSGSSLFDVGKSAD